MADSNPFDVIDQNYASAGSAPASANPFDAIDKQYNATVEKSTAPAATTTEKMPEPVPTEPEPIDTAPEPGLPNLSHPYAPGFKFNPITAPGAGHPVDLYKPELMAPQYKERPHQNLFQNAVGDIGDIITGVAGLANAGVLRSIQAAPKELQSIGIPGQGKALFGHITNAPDVAAQEIDAAWDRGERPDLETNARAWQKAAQYAASDPDAQAVGQFFGNLADYYNQRYVQPWRGGMTPGIEAVKEQFWKHPIGTPLDLGLGGSFKTGLGTAGHIGEEAARLGGRGLSQAALASMGRPGLRRLRKLQRAPQQMWDNFGKDIKERGYVNTLMNETFNRKNNEYYQWFDKIVREMDEAYKAVPDNLKERLTSGIEHVDTEMMDWIKNSPEAQKFVDKLRGFDEGWTQRAIDAGLLTKEQVQFARYAPQYMAEMKKAGIDLKFKDLWTPEGIEDVMDYANAKLAEGGKSPLWMTIREAEKVRDFLVNKAGKPLKTVQEDASLTMDRLESMITQDANGNYTLRVPGMERDALKLAKDGLLRTIRATLIQEAVEELMNNPALKNPKPGWVEVQMDRVFGKQTKAYPTGAMIRQELQKTLYLPKEMAKGLEDLANAPRIAGKVYDAALRMPARVLSKTVLGLDPLRYPKQWLQNAAIFGFTQINSPRDIIPAAVAMGLAANPKVRNWIPGQFWTGQTAVKVAEEFSRDMPKWLQSLAAPDKLLRAHLEAVERQDNYWRAATALSQATRELTRAATPAQLKLFDKSFKLSFWAQKNIKRLFQDEATANRYFDEVKRTMGDYNAELKGVESAIADNVMFYRWKRHSMILTASLPFDNPHKTAALHAIAEVSRTMAESEPVTRRLKEAGAVVARDENGEPIIGPNGDIMVYLKGKTLAFMLTQLEDIRFISKMINREGLGDVDSGSQPFVPFWNIVGGAIGIKPSTMGEFKNPNAVTAGSGGPQVDIKKAKAFMDGSYELKPEDFEQRPQQPWEANLGRNLTGPVYSAIVDFHERIQQIPGVPSDFSTIGTSAPKRTPSGEKRKPAPYAGPFGILQLTEPAMDRETEESIEGTMRNKLRKSYMYKTRDREDLE